MRTRKRKSDSLREIGGDALMSMRTVCRRIVLAILLLLLGTGVFVGTVGNLSHKSYFAALLAAVLLSAAVMFLGRRNTSNFSWLEEKEPLKVCLLLTLLCLVLNGTWVLLFRPVQAPDYQTFFEAASDLASGRPLAGKDYIAMFPHILGYAAFLSVFLRIFGNSILTAALVNVFLTALSGAILYLLCLRYNGKKAAFFAELLWIFCPSKLLYNTMSLSEPLYTCLLQLFFLLVSEIAESCAEQERLGKAAGAGLLSGLVLALVNAARPIGIIPVIAFLLWLLFLSDWESLRNRKKALILFSCLLLPAYFATGSVWKSYAAAQLEQTPPSVPGYSIYVGFNPKTQGSYADEDMELFQSRYFGEYNRNAEAAQQSMLESAKERIAENKSSIPSLMIHKLGTLLGHDEGGAYYSKESMPVGQYSFWCVVSNVWYYLVCLLAAGGCLLLWKTDRKDSLMLVPLCIIGIILAQLLVEVAARYHYCLIPMLILLATSFTPRFRSVGRVR